jgi:hypothetical protein
VKRTPRYPHLKYVFYFGKAQGRIAYLRPALADFYGVPLKYVFFFRECEDDEATDAVASWNMAIHEEDRLPVTSSELSSERDILAVTSTSWEAAKRETAD